VTSSSPWIYPFTESPHGERRHVDGEPVLRPVVPIVLAGDAPHEAARVLALIDSGSERTLAAPGIARQIGVTPDPDRRIALGVGGAIRQVRFADVTLRMQSLADPKEQVEWQADVGFIEEWKPTWAVLLGQSGFFDRFTITFGRHALAFSIEPPVAFDERFKQEIRRVEQGQMDGTIGGLGSLGA
jgi:hypothetical protein